MKLYTEEQVNQMLQVCEDRDLYEEILTFDDVLNTQTPLEIPSYEEIEKRGAGHATFSPSYIAGAEWMRDKILGVKK